MMKGVDAENCPAPIIHANPKEATANIFWTSGTTGGQQEPIYKVI